MSRARECGQPRMTEIFATGIRMGESARWHDGRFWMCDWLAGEVLAFDAAGGREVVARVEGLPFSIDWLPDGRGGARWAGGRAANKEGPAQGTSRAGMGRITRKDSAHPSVVSRKYLAQCTVARELAPLPPPGRGPWDARASRRSS